MKASKKKICNSLLIYFQLIVFYICLLRAWRVYEYNLLGHKDDVKM